VNPADFTAIGGSTFSGAQLPVGLGAHNLAGSQPFGVIVYGFAAFDSYGYPGGLALAPIAAVAHLALSPSTANEAVGSQHCVTASVTDQNNQPLAGITVDFTAGGVNSATGSAVTGGDGNAQFCYVGANAGSDTIVASTGTLVAAATVDWGPGSILIAPKFTG